MRTRGMLSHKDATPQDLIPLYTERSRPRRSERERAAARACTRVRVRAGVCGRVWVTPGSMFPSSSPGIGL